MTDEYGSILNQTIRRYFVNKPLTDEDRAAITETAGNLFFRDERAVVAYTGLVIAGYGDDDIFPSVQHYEVEGLIADFLKTRLTDQFKAGIDPKQHAKIIPFAQQEMVRAFIARGTGVRRRAQELRAKVLPGARGVGSHEQGAAREGGGGGPQRMGPERPGLRGQPRERRAARRRHVAEAGACGDGRHARQPHLVQAPRLPEVESVGGPTDVAIISKSEDFRWFRRKDWDPLYPWESQQNGGAPTR